MIFVQLCNVPMCLHFSRVSKNFCMPSVNINTVFKKQYIVELHVFVYADYHGTWDKSVR